MSFRELRSFKEIMTALGYPRPISMENFRLPNFELVADCLYWLVRRFYPGVDISDDISTESDRVDFLQSVAKVMLLKARMKLNIKRLYSADGIAVKELLKIASLLYKATKKASLEEEDVLDLDVNSAIKSFNVKEFKQYAADIVRAGAALYDALAIEPELRDARLRAAAGHIDSEFVERSVQEAMAQVSEHVRVVERQMEDLQKNEKNVEQKIEKRKIELERSEKRLLTLRSVRPPYMDEYEKLEGELQVLYQQYLERFRNLEYLEAELDQHYQDEQDKMEESDRRLKKMQRRLAEEELRMLRGEQEVDESGIDQHLSDDSDDDDMGDDAVPTNQAARPRIQPAKTTSNVRKLGNGRQVVGSLMGNSFDDDDDDGDDDDDDDDDGSIQDLSGSDDGAISYQQEPNGRMQRDDDEEEDDNDMLLDDDGDGDIEGDSEDDDF